MTRKIIKLYFLSLQPTLTKTGISIELSLADIK